MTDFNADDEDDLLPAAQEKQEVFFRSFAKGIWRQILSPKIYNKLQEWCAEHEEDQDVLIRFSFFDEDHRKPFAVYAICFPTFEDDKIQIQAVRLPSQESFELEGQWALTSVPEPLRKLPLFCVPNKELIGLD